MVVVVIVIIDIACYCYCRYSKHSSDCYTIRANYHSNAKSNLHTTLHSKGKRIRVLASASHFA